MAGEGHFEKIAIVGASGSVGKHIVEHLVKGRKHKVTAISRADSGSKIPDGVAVAHVDYNDEASIVDALKDQDVLIITMSTTAPPDTQAKLINAAAKAGIKWVMPNEYSPDFVENVDMGNDIGFRGHQLAARQQIEQLGMSWTSLICSYWYEFSLAGSSTRYGFDFDSKRLTLLDDGETKINHSTWPQCGRAVAKLLSLKVMPGNVGDQALTLSQFRNKGLYVSSFLLSQKDILASVFRVTGDHESDWEIDSQPAAQRFQQGWEMVKNGQRIGFAQLMYARAFYKDGCGNYEKDGKLMNDALGLPEENLDECTRNAVKMAQTGEAAYH